MKDERSGPESNSAVGQIRIIPVGDSAPKRLSVIIAEGEKSGLPAGVRLVGTAKGDPLRGATAEVCSLVQLSSGSAVYPARHDVLCLLRSASHDEDRVEP